MFGGRYLRHKPTAYTDNAPSFWHELQEFGMEECENFFHDKYGYCYYSIEPDKKPVIYNLYIEQEYRRKGYARKHLQFVINEIRKTGYQGRIEIEAAPRENSIDSEKLISFYKSLGLEIIEGAKNTEQQVQADSADKPLAG